MGCLTYVPYFSTLISLSNIPSKGVVLVQNTQMIKTILFQAYKGRQVSSMAKSCIRPKVQTESQLTNQIFFNANKPQRSLSTAFDYIDALYRISLHVKRRRFLHSFLWHTLNKEYFISCILFSLAAYG